MSRSKKLFLALLVVIVGCLGSGLGLIAANASTPPTIWPSTKMVVCWKTNSHQPTVWRYPYTCPSGWNEEIINAAGVPGAQGPSGPSGPQGVPGADGQQGPAGPSGSTFLATHSFAEHDGVVTGGSFNSLATDLGTASFTAGTYQVCLNAKVEQPVAATGEVSAQLFLYNQAKNPGFAGDLLNLSVTPQAGTDHDAYLSGCKVVVVPPMTSQTFHLYGFGYDSDNGAGSYNFMGGTLDVTKLTPALAA